MKKVVKFGGSSLASARQFKKVADIIKSDKSRRYVVPSAPGKRSDKDEKVTDLLYACYDAVAEGRSYKKILEKIKSRYMDIIDGLDLNLNLDHEFDRIEENFLAKAGRDYAASRGEYLNGIVAANFLGFEFVDAAEVIFFDENGNLSQSTPTGSCLSAWSMWRRLSSLVFMVQGRTGPSKHFPEAVQMSPAPSWPRPSTQICTRTGRMCQAFW